MKRGLSALLAACIGVSGAMGLAACRENEFLEDPGNVLTVYFSAQGHTEAVAGYIAEATGGTLFELVPVEPYTSDDLRWTDDESRVVQEHENEELQNSVELVTVTPDGWENYDTVFLGYPIWWGIAAWPVNGFVTGNDFSGKTVIPFCTSSSSGIGESGDLLAETAGTGDWREGHRFRSSASQSDVVGWLETLGDFTGGDAGSTADTVTPDTGDTDEEQPDGGYMPPPETGDGPAENAPTADIAVPTPDVRQTILLWNEGNIPAYNESYQAASADDLGFIPYIESFPAQGEVKGAVLICPGGAFQFRSTVSEGYNVAEELSARGYQCFVVSYRLRPYSQEVSALDLARAVRYVRANAEAYGIEEDDIAVVGFSAGGILCGELLLHNDGHQLPTESDPDYVPDSLDYVSAEASAIGHIYSFYGRLSVSDNNVETLRAGDLPPTFYAYGTRDPFYRQFIQNADAVREAGVEVEEHVFENVGHGFGAGNASCDWIPSFDTFLTNIFEEN